MRQLRSKWCECTAIRKCAADLASNQLDSAFLYPHAGYSSGSLLLFAAQISAGIRVVLGLYLGQLDPFEENDRMEMNSAAATVPEPAKVAEYRAGRDKMFGFFIGLVMKEMGGKANPKVINEVLRRKLSGN